MARAAQVHVLAACLGPHLDVAHVDVGAGRLVGTYDLDGTALGTVGLRAAPVLGRDVRERDAVAGDGAHGRPVLVDVERICVAVADEVLKHDVFDVPTATVGFDHHHLVRFPGVDVLVLDLGDGGVGAQRAHAAPTRPVAVDVFDEEVGGRRFDGDTFVFVGDHDLWVVSDIALGGLKIMSAERTS